MKNQRILLPYLYALITIVCTFLVGQLILWFVPDNTNIWASVLFIFHESAADAGCLWFRADVR